MEEKNIVNATFEKKKITLILYILGIVSSVIGIIFSIWVYFNEEFKYYYSIYPVANYEYVPYYQYKDFPLFFLHYGRKEGFGYFVVLGILFILMALIISWRIGKCNLTVTDKCIKGQTFFGSKIDLPIDTISGVVEIKLLNGIKILSPAKKINYILMKNATEISKAISDVITFNPKEKSNSNNHSDIISNSDELKKLKDLLDMGIITQEEFDAKKKQLLGL